MQTAEWNQWISILFCSGLMTLAVHGQSAEPVRVGIVSIDNYQALAFTELFHNPPEDNPALRGLRVVAACPGGSPDLEESFPWERFPWPRANLELARGLGSALTGDPSKAEAALNRLNELRERAESEGEDYFAQQIEISRLLLAGVLAHTRGAEEEAFRLLRASAELEASTEKHPVTPASVQPAAEIYGDLLLASGHAERGHSAMRGQHVHRHRLAETNAPHDAVTPAVGTRTPRTTPDVEVLEVHGVTPLEDLGVGQARVRHMGVHRARALVARPSAGAATNGFVVLVALVAKSEVIHRALGSCHRSQRSV